MKIPNKHISIFDKFLDITAYFVGCVILCLMFAVCLNVIFRYFFDHPITGVEEITEYFLLIITFIGSAWLLREEQHVKVDILFVMITPIKELFLNIVNSCIGIFISLILIWYGTKVSWEHFQSHAYFSSILEFPKAPIFSVIPIGSVFLLIQFIRRALHNYADWKSQKEQKQSDIGGSK